MGRGGKLPPLLLSEDEAVAVSISLRDTARFADPATSESALSSLMKLLQIMPSALADRVEALDAVTESAAPHPGPSGPIDLTVLLAAALASRRGERVRFSYRRFEGEPSERRVEPHRIVSFNRKWYLVAFDLDRDDWRTFRLDRIAELVATGHRNTPGRAEPDVVELVREGVTVRAYEVHADVLVHAPLVDVLEFVPPSVGVCEATDDPATTRVRLGGDLDWLARRLAILPAPFEIRSPDSLRAEVCQLARRLLDQHGDATSGGRPVSPPGAASTRSS